MTTYKSLAFTIRPRDGVVSEGVLEKSVIKYLQKHQGFVVSEGEEHTRHLHGQVFYDTDRGKSLSELKKILIKYNENDLNRPLEPAEKKHGFRIKIAYSDDYYAEYCNKHCDITGDLSTMLYEDMPPDTSSYYPSEEEQQLVKAKAAAVDQKFFSLATKFAQSPFADVCSPPCIRDVAKFYYDAMFVSCTVHVIMDGRKRTQTIRSLHEYLLKDNSRALRFMVPELDNTQFINKALSFVANNQ